MAELAENMDGIPPLDQQDDPEGTDQQNNKRDKNDPALLEKMTERERRMLKEGTTIKELVAEREQLKKSAEAELNHLVTATSKEENYLTLAEYKEWQQKLEETMSPEKMERLLDEIQEIPKKKQSEAQKKKDGDKELPPESTQLLDLQRQFEKICDDNAQLIGEKQVPGFKAWFEQERRRKPSINHLKEIIKKLEGKDIADKDGLAPRREEYDKLKRLYAKHKLGAPEDESEYILKEGLSERQTFRKNAEDLEKHLDHQRDTGFYSKEMITQTMQEVLTAKTPQDQEKLLNEAKKIARKESESFTHLDSKMSVGGKQIRKMSEKSKKKLLDYYKNSSFKERDETDWKKLVEYEGDLAKELEEIYKEDPKGLSLAVDSFQNLDFVEKQGALKEHKKKVEEKEDHEELHKELIIKGAHSAIDKAAEEKTIGEKTQNRYKELFEDEENYKNPDTKKPGDIKTLEKMYEILKSDSPQAEHKNLAAYKQRRDKFQKDLKTLEDIHPDMDEKEKAEWEEKYDSEGWTKRELVHTELKKAIEKQKHENIKTGDLEGKLGKKERKEGKELPGKLELIDAATLLMAENDPQTALEELLAYNKEKPGDKQILFLIETAAKQLRELGSKEKGNEEKAFEEELDKEIEEVAGQKEHKDDIEEAQIYGLNIDGSLQNTERHQRKEDARDRAEDESMEKARTDEVEKALTEDFYAEAEDEYILNEKGTGEKIEELDYTEVSFTDEERQAMKQETYHKQGKLITKEGFADVNFTDRSGKIISAREARDLQDKENDKIAEDLTEEAMDRMEIKNAATHPSDKILDTQERIRAKRRAKAYVDKRTHERIKMAA